MLTSGHFTVFYTEINDTLGSFAVKEFPWKKHAETCVKSATTANNNNNNDNSLRDFFAEIRFIL